MSEALLVDSVGLALLVVLETLTPQERHHPRLLALRPRTGLVARSALVNGARGWVLLLNGQPYAAATGTPARACSGQPRCASALPLRT
jgi:hypothetical protein